MPVLDTCRLLAVGVLALCLSACQTLPLPTMEVATATPARPAVASPAAQNVQPQSTTVPTRLAPPTTTPVPTDAPRPTATPSPTITLSPTPRPSPTPTATPVPPLRRLTDGGCCVAPSWSDDSTRVIYLDRPSPDAPTGYYAIDVTKPGAQPELFQSRIETWTGDFKYLVKRGDGIATVERAEDKKIFRINTGRCSTTQPTGCNVTLSPDRSQVIWSITAEATGPFEQRRTRIWVANIDGSNARVVANWYSTRANAGWFPDNQKLILTGRPSLDSQELVITVLDLETGQQTELVRGERINRGGLSPDSQWLVYTIQFHEKEELNGIWLVKTDGSVRRKLPFFGANIWRAPGRLLYTPLLESADFHQFWEYDAVTDTSRPLTDPETTRFKIGYGDWALSPDGKRIVFVNAADRNLWLLDLKD